MSKTTKTLPNSFLLPDKLGWECNDEISKLMDVWLVELMEYVESDKSIHSWMWAAAKAQLMDDMYAIIKKYEEK